MKIDSIRLVLAVVVSILVVTIAAFGAAWGSMLLFEWDENPPTRSALFWICSIISGTAVLALGWFSGFGAYLGFAKIGKLLGKS
jgi:hypothetical protein